MTETVNSAAKRSLGFAVRARFWFREFREITLVRVVYNLKRTVKQQLPTPYSDSTRPLQLILGYAGFEKTRQLIDYTLYSSTWPASSDTTTTYFSLI
jgi:hypothetical protein